MSLAATAGLGVAMVAALALVMVGLYLLGVSYGAPLALLGIYLPAYRFAFNERGKKSTWNAEFMAVLSCGSSLVLLAPVLSWPSPVLGIPLLLFVGQFLATPLICHPMCGGIVVSVPLGVCIGALSWHLGVCRVAAFAAHWGVPSANAHKLVLALAAIFFVQVFVCCGRVAGPANFHRVLVPLLAGVYCSTGCASMLPASCGLTLEALLKEAPCAVDLSSSSGPLCCLTLWLLTSGLGFFAHAYTTARKEKKQERNGNGSLVKGLLPESNDEPRAMDRPSMEDTTERFGTIVRAIQDESFDLSTLDDTARGIVEVCRKDEEERYRLMFGGGLL